MQWYDLNYKLEDGTTISHSADGFTRDRNLKDLFKLYRDKVNEVESKTMMQDTSMSTLRVYVDDLNRENEMLKKLVAKMITKDYPELVIEMPEFITQVLQTEKQKDTV